MGQLVFLLPGKIRVLKALGTFFSKRRQTNEAVKNLESALEEAKTVYHEKPHIIMAQIRNDLGLALMDENLEKSLLHFQKAKQIMDQIIGSNHAHSLYITSLVILYNIGSNYLHRGDLAKAFQYFKDALNMSSIIYGENIINETMGGLCSNFACTAEKMGKFSLAKEYYTKAIKINRKRSLTKTSCNCYVVANLHRLSWTCEALGEQDDALKHLEEAREIAKDAGFKHWIVVDILVSLIKKYAEMGCMIKSIMCYVEAGEIAKSLPKDDSLALSILEMLQLMKI